MLAKARNEIFPIFCAHFSTTVEALQLLLTSGDMKAAVNASILLDKGSKGPNYKKGVDDLPANLKVLSVWSTALTLPLWNSTQSGKAFLLPTPWTSVMPKLELPRLQPSEPPKQRPWRVF